MVLPLPAGVQNGGNSCQLSVLLQEHVAAPEIYDPLWSSPLSKMDGESDFQFEARKKLQTLFRGCVDALKAGQMVNRQSVRKVQHLLYDAGWNGNFPSVIYRILHQIAPRIFRPYQASALELHRIVTRFFQKEIAVTYSEYTNQVEPLHSFFKGLNLTGSQKRLLRISVTSKNETQLLDRYTGNGFNYTLKQINVCQKTLLGHHIVAYRKVGKYWFCFDDDKVKMVDQIPLKGINSVIYEAERAFQNIEFHEPLKLQRSQNEKGSKYAFSQQIHMDCHLRAWVNLERLAVFRRRSSDGTVEFLEGDYFNRRQWLGENFREFQSWLSVGKQHLKVLNDYFLKALEEAPLFPHFYTKKGKSFYSATLNPLEKDIRRAFVPYFFMDLGKRAAPTPVPVFKIGDEYRCYNADTHAYEPVASQESHQGWFSKKVKILTPAEGQNKAFFDPSHMQFKAMRTWDFLGSSSMIAQEDITLKLAQKNYLPKDVGIYKLMLLTLGVDENNLDIGPKHPQKALYADLKKAAGSQYNPWGRQIFKKENLIEYALADLFKKDAQLMKQVEACVDFYFPAWKLYEKTFPELYDQNKKQMKDKQMAQYIPGKEQMLAYYFMKNVQYLWWCSMSNDAFCSSFGLPKDLKLLHKAFPERFKKLAYQRGFVDTVKNVFAKLPVQKDWASFSGHGFVLSFDKDLIFRQNSRSIQDRQLASDLGFAAIDSLYGSELDTFYRLKIEKKVERTALQKFFLGIVVAASAGAFVFLRKRLLRQNGFIPTILVAEIAYVITLLGMRLVKHASR